MPFRARPRTTRIGLDAGARRLVAAQLARDGQGWALRAATVMPRRDPSAPIDDAEAAAFVSQLRREGILGRAASFAVPPKALAGAVLTVPDRGTGAPVDQIARTELARVRGVSSRAFEADTADLPRAGRSGEGQQVLARLCLHDDAEALLGPFERAGLEPVTLEPADVALRRATAAWRDDDGLAAVIHLGWEGAHMSVLHRGAIVYHRSIEDAGVGALCESLAGAFRVEPTRAEALLTATREELDATHVEPGVIEPLRRRRAGWADWLASEIDTAMSYAAHQYPDARGARHVLVGDAAHPAITEALAIRLDGETIPLKPSDLVACPPSLSRDAGDPSLTLAIGLAMPAWSAAPREAAAP